MKFLPLIFSLIIHCCYGQNKFDSKVIIKATDTVNLYKIVKIALVNSDFIVKDNYNLDTLTTYGKEIRIFPGFASVRAIISGDIVTLTGAYGFKNVDFWGFTNMPDTYKRIIYYKGSKTWKILLKVAEKIHGTISFSE